MEKEYVCECCGAVIEYQNVTWCDSSRTKHTVCDVCNDAISEEYDEDRLPSSELFLY